MGIQFDGINNEIKSQTKIDFPGSVGVAGTLTYEDVTNIDSVGVITARTDINIGDSIIHIGDTNTKIRFPAADIVTVETGGSERLRVLDSGGITVKNGDDQFSTTFEGGSSGSRNFVSVKAGNTTSGHNSGFRVTHSDGNAVLSMLVNHNDDNANIMNEHQGGALIFHTNESGSVTEKLRIHSGGEVTKPAHPSFIAGRTGGNQTFTVGTFPLNVARLNVGNHYNTSTYKFVAPVAGVYYFYGQVYYNNGTGTYRLGFRKTPNGGSAFMLNTAQLGVTGNDNQQNISIIESLAVGDTVELYSDQNGSIQCYYNINAGNFGAHTYFMGYLIG